MVSHRVVDRGDGFVGPRAFLSNFAATPFEWDGRMWPDVETAFQAAKSLDPVERDRVAAAGSPGVAKRLGRAVSLRPGWDALSPRAVRVEVMAELLAAKFAPGSPLAVALDGTGDVELVEHNTWGDRFWGRVDGRGVNMLGRLLMARRAMNRVCGDGPVLDVHADLWDLNASGAWAVVPTNTMRRRDGTAVMGAGVALAASKLFDGLDVRYGAALAAGNVHMGFGGRERLLCVPTKPDFRVPSTLDDISDAADALVRWTGAHPGVPVAVPALGVGLGGLDWDVVRELLFERLAGRSVVLLPPR